MIDDELVEDEELDRFFESLGPEERFKIWSRFLESHPDNAWGWARLAFEAEDLGRIEESKDYLEKSISIDKNSKNAARVYFNLGLLLENKLDDPFNARLNYLNSIRVNQDYDRPYNNLGLLLLKKFNEVDLAKEYFLEAISRWPTDANLHHNLSYLYADYLKEEDKAAVHLKIALELDPENEDIQNDLNLLQCDQDPANPPVNDSTN